MNNQMRRFRKPPKPLSFGAMVKKILADPEFAKFIHQEVIKARGGDQTAADEVFDYFWPLPEELEALRLPADMLEHRDVNDVLCTSTLLLIDFATPAQIWTPKP
jgi:hypothetical protein